MRTTVGQIVERARRVIAGAPPTSGAGSANQIYPGYAPRHEALLASMVVRPAELQADRIVDGFGQTTLFRCVPFASDFDLERLSLPIPDDGYHAEASEYVAVADSVKRAGSRYCIAELGAGWGPWLGLGGVMARNKGIRQIELIGVEALPARFELMQAHLASNRLRPEAGEATTLEGVTCHLFNGAVTPTRGEVWFPDVPITDMGSAVSETESNRDYRGKRVKNLKVQGHPLPEILGDSRPDLLHIDVQGAELGLIEANLALHAERVQGIMIGTHSRVIEGALIDVLYANGWQLELEKPCRVAWRANPPSMEAMTVVDGCQYWRRAG
jgi:FkbM family methyltransferase